MLEVIITYVDKKMPVETFAILTYLRGDGYWQFLTTEGSTVCVPDHAVQKVEILPMQESE
jgi:hypothetical protein|tara:strand:- start:755 stop:934 length:180 start_codon:yes stop_codon:yes gene_type:complete